MMLSLTTEAADFIRCVQQEEGKSDHFLRLMRGSGGDDANLQLAFVAAAESGDQVGQSHGVAMCVDGGVAIGLDDMLLDLRETTAGHALVLRPRT
jgi:Fe-S cluster assembly iron-binding protein IscA